MYNNTSKNDIKQASAHFPSVSGANTGKGRAAPLGITTNLAAIPKPRGIETFETEVISPDSGEILNFSSDKNFNHRLKFDHDDFRIRKYALQATSRSILPASFVRDGKTKSFRVKNCLRSVLTDGGSVDLYKSAESQKSHYSGLQVCGSVWTCPVCAAKITEKRSKTIADVVDSHLKLNKPVYLVTFTFPHKYGDNLKHLLTKFKAALNSFHISRKTRDFKKSRGFIESIKSLEITFSNTNGWHPHQHELWFFDSFISLRRLKKSIFDEWSKYCQKRGLGIPSEQFGIDVKRGCKASYYISKMGWDISREVSKGHTKKGRNSSYAPFDLLELYLTDRKSFAKKRFIEYAQYTFGLHYISRFPKLLKMYSLEDEKTDEQLAQEKDESSFYLGSITYSQWRKILKHNARIDVLLMSEKNSFKLVLEFIDSLSISSDTS